MRRTTHLKPGKGKPPTAAEEWRDVPDFGGHYQASSHGRVRVKDRIVRKPHASGRISVQRYGGRLLTPYLVKDGYLHVHIGWDGNRKNVSVHHLVLLAFHGERPDGAVGCHCNGVPDDNRPENLRWDTHTGNMADRQRHGNYSKGEAHPMAKISDDTARQIKASGLTVTAIVSAYGISRTQAYRIIKGERGGLA